MSQMSSKSAKGLTLLEAMVATAVLAIAALGALSYQYHAARQGRVASAQMTATRIAQLLLEDWKSTGGSAEYDPSRLGLGFSSALAVPSDFPVMSTLGSTLHNAAYAIEVDNTPMLVTLRCRDVAHDEVAEVTLRQLAVIIKFASPPKIDVHRNGNTSTAKSILKHRLKNVRPVVLTTYVRVDASAG